MGITPAFLNLPGINPAGLQDGDVFQYDAATGTMIPLTLPSPGITPSIAYFRGSDSVSAGGTAEAIDLTSATDSVLVNASLTGSQIVVPAGTYQYTLSVIAAPLTVASLDWSGGTYGPNLSLNSGATFPGLFGRAFFIQDLVTPANTSGATASITAIETFAAQTTISTTSTSNQASSTAAISFDYYLSVVRVG